ncbi:MAG: hypothetical protein PHI70_09930 [Proteiniphilum sp.]|nr:hypothetical protein [Fermentimonas sp.]MDD4417086.1 hypothetical protein [Proteiniphilum sp.]
MPRVDEDGNLEFHPLELPPDYRLPEMDRSNTLLRKKAVFPKSIRKCKTCGKDFELTGEYDPDNKAHDLCDDCLLNLPPDPNQKYPARTYQLEQDGGTSLTEEEL